MLANEGENLYGLGIAVLVWVLKAILAFGALVLLVSVVLVGGISLLRRTDPTTPKCLAATIQRPLRAVCSVHANGGMT